MFFLFFGVSSLKLYVVDESGAQFGDAGVSNSYNWCVFPNNLLRSSAKVR